MVNKRIAVTPIQLDLTARRLLGRLNSWSWELPGKLAATGAPAAVPMGEDAERTDDAVTAQAPPKDERR